MVKASSGRAEAVVLADIADNFLDLPIKNTFIHFANSCNACGIGCARRSKSSSILLRKTHGASIGDVSSFSPPSATRFDSTPENSPRWTETTTAISSDSEDVPSQLALDLPQSKSPLSLSCATTVVSTPEHSPRGEEPARALMPPCSWVWPSKFEGFAGVQTCLVSWNALPVVTATIHMQPLPVQPAPAAVPIKARPPPWMRCDVDDVFFGFMLRRADGVEFGLDVDCVESNRALLVNAVLPGGAIEAWNRQVTGTPKAEKVIRCGDMIVGINGKSDTQSMLNELTSSILLKLEVVRRNAAP